jgi:putative peptide zinc metalloprotease protein
VTTGWRLGWAVSAAILFVAALACDATSAPASTDSPTPAPAGATPTPKPDFDAGVILEEFPEGAPRNEVRLQNPQDKRFMARASVKMYRIHGVDIRPYNLALAQAQCTDCQTIAVAVQVVFYQRGATNIQPENIAIASNFRCNHCVTIAKAIQYVIPVDDLKADVPDEVKSLVKDIDKELRYFASMKSVNELSSREAADRLQQVLSHYSSLQQYLHDAMTERTQDNEPDPQVDSGASPSPSGAAPASATPGTAEPTASSTTSPTPVPSATP